MKPPEYLGPYRIGETLGKGGMGSVFKAQHAKSGQEVAVKLIATQMSDEMRFRRRFNAEIETLKRLSHPNIVKLIGYGEEQGMLFYSMEYVPGETLQGLIRRDKKLPWMLAIEIAIQVCAALKHAHDFGVIHRDLKPANLIVGDDGSVKLLDFGISKIFGNDQTAVGSIMGTADFMSPEQAAEQGTTARTDLFALGCVIYAMLCGKPPFRGKNITEVMTALKQKDPVPLDLIDPELPDDVVQIVNELLEKDPKDRPPTALAVMNRLKAMHAGLQRMQTMSDKASDSSGKTSSGESTDQQPGHHKIADEDTPDGDTLQFAGQGSGIQTEPAKVDPSAGTVFTEGKGGDHGTILGTGVTAPVQAKSNGEGGNESDSDTSAGLTGKTHFQTVSDGEVREGFFSSPQSKTEHPVARYVSIVVLTLILLIGGGFMIHSLRGPTADQVLAIIDAQDDATLSHEAQDEMERFLKLFPDHPRADEIHGRQMALRLVATVRRLKRKAKLRTSEGPLYEQVFLEAMDLRDSDPMAAQEKLDHWINVFKDSTMDPADRPVQLAELARFESDRLALLQSESQEVPDDPKLAELMQRIDSAKQLPVDERRKLLGGIVTLYEGQPWAQKARQRANELLGNHSE